MTRRSGSAILLVVAAALPQAIRNDQADVLSSARFIEEQGVLELRAALEEIEKTPHSSGPRQGVEAPGQATQ